MALIQFLGIAALIAGLAFAFTCSGRPSESMATPRDLSGFLAHLEQMHQQGMVDEQEYSELRRLFQ
ncbi:hypothetical protein SAMN04488540_12147 [Ferrimonas sediminum]|uniref:Short C-terminal domain-containing protein n=1 Tax=Ferrimonas sediminum TaxID=718193 RepID=A0A1G9A0V4_9GAMM|nr:hypothetical protein [Ferrimonas sediminum]SDK20215.1 hypothetical protein SAMN04488540_12147 [Ferrimonas sediminum]